MGFALRRVFIGIAAVAAVAPVAVAAVAPAGALAGAAAAAQGPAGDRLTARLRRAAEGARAGELVPAYVVMAARPDFDALGRELAPIARGARGRALAARLRAHDAAARGAVLATLASARARGEAERVVEIYVANVVAFRARPAVIDEVASLPGVGYVGYDAPAPAATADAAMSPAVGPAAASAPAELPPVGTFLAPHLVKIDALPCWLLGTAGQGITICLIDDGTAHDHPSLKNHIWANPGEIPNNGVDDDGNGLVDDVRGWNFGTNTNDTYGLLHGTRTAGLVVGDGSLVDPFGNQWVTGVAPESKLMLTVLGTTQSSFWSCEQYGIAMGADVVSSSHSFKWVAGEYPDLFVFREMADAELAAGILHVNSTGNQGNDPNFPLPFNIPAPAGCPSPHRHFQQMPGGLSSTLAVGAVLLSDQLYTGSGVGPSAWEDVLQYAPSYPYLQEPADWDYPWAFGTKAGLLKPDLTAPTQVTTTTGNNAYVFDFFGTSAAAPQVSGTAALMLAANPQLEPRHVAHLLQATAVDLGVPGKDVLHGAGRIRAFEAVKRSLVSVKAVPNVVGLSQPVKIEAHTLPGKPTYILGAIFDFPLFVPGIGTLDVAPPFDFLVFGLVSPQADFTAASFIVPYAPILVGLTFYFQMGVDDTSGATGQWLLSAIEPLKID